MLILGVPLVLLSLLPSTLAWLPGVDKDIKSPLTGRNLFKRNLPNVSPRWLPTDYKNSRQKIRGVNLGNLFVYEPWMARKYWNETIGCAEQKSEFDCVSHLTQAVADQRFGNHWSSWITQSDFPIMESYHLNTVRIPVGYWMMESLVDPSEHFPRGGFKQLLKVCDWARAQGFYVIIDMHGAPYSQSGEPNPDTGQFTYPGFYDNRNAYSRSYTFLYWLAQQVHIWPQMANVGMIGILNEPVQNKSRTASMLNEFYPNAFNKIRQAENDLGNVSAAAGVHIQMMNTQWGSGNPEQSLTSNYQAAYDDHRYLKYDNRVPVTMPNYLSTSCSDNRGGNYPTIVGEWSLSTPGDVWNPYNSSNLKFYRDWWSAQVVAYEKQQGWIFWSWRTDLNDPRWDYRLAVNATIIQKNPDAAYKSDGSTATGCP